MKFSVLEKQIFRKLLSNPDIMVNRINKLSPNDFISPTIKLVIEAFKKNTSNMNYFTANSSFFEILLRDYFHEPQKLDEISKILAGIANRPIPATDIDMLIRELKSHRMCRELTASIKKIIPAIKPDSVDVAYEKLLKGLLQLPLTASREVIAAKVRETHEEVGSRINMYLEDAKYRLPTCIKAFDASMGGFAPGEFVVISAGTAQGKSNLMLWWAEQFVEKGFNVAYVTIEMSYEATMNRYNAIQTGFNTVEIARKRISKNLVGDYFAKLIAAGKDKNVRQAFLRECECIRDKTKPEFALEIAKKYIDRAGKMFIVDMESANPSRIEQEIKRLSLDQKIDCVFVDFINVMDPDFHNKDRVRELGIISRELKKMSRRLESVVFSAAQLDTSTLTGIQDEKITSDKVKYSRAIPENADWLFTFHRTDQDKALNHVKLQLTKGRNAPEVVSLLEINFATMQVADHGFAPNSFVPFGYDVRGTYTVEEAEVVDIKEVVEETPQLDFAKPSSNAIELSNEDKLSNLAKVFEIGNVKTVELSEEDGLDL